MIDGLVSNCWETLLEDGETVAGLIGKAQERAFRFVELRQTCLGEYESEALIPDAERLHALAKQFPEMTITLALCVPFMSGNLDLEGELIVSGIRAAEALAGKRRPHLRLVDLSPPSDEIHRETEDQAARKLAALAARLAEREGVLSLENAIHPWSKLMTLLERTRGELGSQSHALQLCFDPCNRYLREGSESEFPASLSASNLSMVHIKQARAGEVLPVVAEGKVDWERQLRGLRRIGYAGPILLEIAPSTQVWEQIERSRAYLTGLGF